MNTPFNVSRIPGTYMIVWQYVVKHDCVAKFEAEYGPSGSWHKLFSESHDYLGSFLHKSGEDAYTYLLVDTWSDKTSYENFKKENADRYEALSQVFAELYTEEKLLGCFVSI